MRIQSTRYQLSSRYKAVDGDLHNFRIQGDPALEVSLADRSIWRETEKLTVETCVRAGQTSLVAIVTVDVELAHSVHAFQFLETVERYLGGTGDELQQLGTLLLVK